MENLVLVGVGASLIGFCLGIWYAERRLRNCVIEGKSFFALSLRFGMGISKR